MMGCWVIWWGLLDSTVGSVGLYGGVLSTMVGIVGLHCGRVLGYIVGCWVTWWGFGLHGGVGLLHGGDYLVASLRNIWSAT